MSRQHATPILVPASDTAVPLSLAQADWNEDRIQALVHDHPECLPIKEIDPIFSDPVPLCREMNTRVGPIDNIMVTPGGLPVLIECKLWRNPQARREVIGQILDYAKELSRWTASDLQREVRRRAGRSLVDLVLAAGHSIGEIGFTDALTLNLRRGRFLLLIVGDGIREGVETIAEYLQAHSGLHFTLGLVELPIYTMPDGSRLVAPRVLARTELVRREVIEVPTGMTVVNADTDLEGSSGRDRNVLATEQQSFWDAFLRGLTLDDPEQQIPKAARQGYLNFMQPAPQGSCWLTVYRDIRSGEVGVSLSSAIGIGGDAVKQLATDWPDIERELGGTATLTQRNGRPWINDFLRVGSLDDPEDRQKAFIWLRKRTNKFVNVLRPRIRAAVANLSGG